MTDTSALEAVIQAAQTRINQLDNIRAAGHLAAVTPDELIARALLTSEQEKADMRKALIEEIAREIERYGEGLVPELQCVTYWLAPHIRALTDSVPG